MFRVSKMLAILGLIAYTGDALAYLDPSTGSMLISAIVGIFASVALALKTYWYKLKSLFSGRSRNARDQGEDQSG